MHCERNRLKKEMKDTPVQVPPLYVWNPDWQVAAEQVTGEPPVQAVHDPSWTDATPEKSMSLHTVSIYKNVV